MSFLWVKHWNVAWDERGWCQIGRREWISLACSIDNVLSKTPCNEYSRLLESIQPFKLTFLLCRAHDISAITRLFGAMFTTARKTPPSPLAELVRKPGPDVSEQLIIVRWSYWKTAPNVKLSSSVFVWTLHQHRGPCPRWVVTTQLLTRIYTVCSCSILYAKPVWSPFRWKTIWPSESLQ